MLAKKANLNRCGQQCKAEVRRFSVVTEWRQMAITVYRRAIFMLSIPYFDPHISSFSQSFTEEKNKKCIHALKRCCCEADTDTVAEWHGMDGGKGGGCELMR